MRVFTREIIEDFANEMQNQHYEEAFNWFEVAFTNIIEDLRKKTPIITDYEFVVVGDFLTSTFTQNSEIDIFIAFKSPQLELNSIKLSNDKLKRFWLRLKKAYILTRQERKSRRRRRRKREKEEKIVEIPSNKYTMLDLKKQLMQYLSRALTADATIYPNQNGFKIVSRNQIGIDINVYPAIKTEQGYKTYHESKGRFTLHNFKELERNLLKKEESVGPVYFNVVRVFKNLYFNINSSTTPKPYLIESLIYNCPNNLFLGNNFYEVFIKILNYLNNVNISEFLSILDSSQKLFSNELIDEPITVTSSFLRKIDNFIY